MATVHTAYGPGRIIDQETVRGRTRYKVAGEGFEVWLDQTKLGGYETPAGGPDFDAPHWEGHNLDDGVTYPDVHTHPGDEYDDDQGIPGRFDRSRLRERPDYEGYSGYGGDDPAHYSRKMASEVYHDDPYAEHDFDEPEDVHNLRNRLHIHDLDEDDPARYSRRQASGYDESFDDDPYAEHEYDDHFTNLRDRFDGYDGYDDDDPAKYSSKRVVRGKESSSRTAWAPLDRDNSTDLPYNPKPQFDAIGTPGDDNSATLQPIHHIDPDERLRNADSLTFEDEGDDDGPGPSAELFAREAAIALQAGIPPWLIKQQIKQRFPKTYKKVMETVERGVGGATGNPELGKAVMRGGDSAIEVGKIVAPLAAGNYALDKVMNATAPGYGWGNTIKSSSLHEAGPEMLLPLVAPALRALAPSAISHLMGGGDHEGGDMVESSDPGSWGGLVTAQNQRPAGLSDRYIDLTASVDYWNDPVAQFRHDPAAYINRIGHLMDEGLDPRFAEYMELVEGDRNIRTAAWKDVRKKAMRLKREGHVTVKDMSPSSIMASVVGDHGTYDVTILKGASIGGITGNSIANWHCACEWGKWAFRRKYTYVGRLCSHAYASYLTMQSAAMKGQRPTRRRSPSDAIIVNRPARERYLPTFTFAAGRRTADALQNGPERITPEMVVNDTDDAHIFVDVTKDERKDVGPDDVVSEKDIVHFARVMAECERTEQPYPRQLVSFLARYAGCGCTEDDTQADYEASDAGDADGALSRLRDLADDDAEDSFGSMADRVHEIQDAVEEARYNGADASQFVAAVRRIAKPGTVSGQPVSDKGKSNSSGAPPGYKAVPGGAEGTQLYREVADGKSVAEAYGADRGNRGIEVGPNGNKQVRFDGDGKSGVSGNSFEYDGGAYGGPTGYADPQAFADSFTGAPPPDATKSNGARGGRGGNPLTPQSVGNGDAKTPTPGPGQQAAPPSNQGVTNGQPAVAPSSSGKGNDAGAGSGSSGGASRPMTQGPISDGGVAGAENGNNTAITKGGPNVDADGYYTVQKGDTLSDIAQRAYGDMNKYQDIAKGNKDITNVDQINEGQRIKLDNLNDVGNNGVKGDVTNPAGGGPDKNPATQDFEVGITSPSGNTLSTAQGFAGGAPAQVNTDTAAGKAPAAAPPAGNTATDAVPPPAPAAPAPETPAPAAVPPAAGQKPQSMRRRAADGDGGNETAPTTESPSADAANPGTGGAATPAINPANPGGGTNRPAMPGGPSDSDVYDPNDSAQVQRQNNSAANPGTSMPSMPSMPGSGGGMNMNGIGNMIGQGVGAASNIASGIGNMMGGGGLASGIGGLASGIGNAIGGIFSSKQDVDDWYRYAYPAGGGDDFDPETMPHIPFAGSGNPGPLEIGTSEDYADKARKKHDDVTDLGDDPLSTPMGKWQRQSALEDGFERDDRGTWAHSDDERLLDHPDLMKHIKSPHQRGYGSMVPIPEGHPILRGASFEDYDDSSDIVRAFQANMGNTALGSGAGGGGGRFDDFSGAAQGFLRTAGRNYSLAEQSELIREGDKGGAGNLRSLDLAGTHYEDMDSLGW